MYEVVPPKEQRWEQYPKKDWEHECPKSPNNLVGKKTQFKSHPKKVDQILDNQYTELYWKINNGLRNYTEYEENTECISTIY